MILILWMKALIQKYCLYFTGKRIWNRSNSLQLSQNLTADSLLIYKFCTNNWPGIAFFWFAELVEQFHVSRFYKTLWICLVFEEISCEKSEYSFKINFNPFLETNKNVDCRLNASLNLVLHDKKRYVFWLQTITFTLF